MSLRTSPWPRSHKPWPPHYRQAKVTTPFEVQPTLANVLSIRRARVLAAVGALFLLTHILYRSHETLVATPESLRPECQLEEQPFEIFAIDWSAFAYIQYVTNSAYLCNSVMLFEVLHRLGSKADRVMMYPSYMVDPDATHGDTEDARLILKARDEYDVRLVPITIKHRDSADPTWADSYTKLLAFNQTAYKRVLSLDSDSTILQPMDELFLLPSCPVAMPRAYWLYPEESILSSQVMLIQPSTVEFERIMGEIDTAGQDDYDMEIANELYRDSALVLPHRPYNLLTGEFGNDDHVGYLGSDREEWDPVAVYNEAKFVHFSDWPVPKPWLPSPDGVWLKKQPKCS
ncbi:hypothetical protein S40288_10442, partial [Stachybotrys chartarum IBT 40288]